LLSSLTPFPFPSTFLSSPFPIRFLPNCQIPFAFFILFAGQADLKCKSLKCSCFLFY
jgi:hypothetical protein